MRCYLCFGSSVSQLSALKRLHRLPSFQNHCQAFIQEQSKCRFQPVNSRSPIVGRVGVLLETGDSRPTSPRKMVRLYYSVYTPLSKVTIDQYCRAELENSSSISLCSRGAPSSCWSRSHSCQYGCGVVHGASLRAWILGRSFPMVLHYELQI